ncbi:hypothetical protein [Aurantiacibacter zhengii]|uniref:Uncharacterized protein n=1 Tax=Aurantiacibacter zhengii TaxID=2307003 RepID=A0A418NW18_9SPHN|nr:hypothetical protein [Aurantiacibacter zhengii]RIV88817.1 hypothetical protein D2V07_00630 [Aurantiacibacter zhengii]
MTDKTDTFSGEARLKSRRNSLWRFCAIGTGIAAGVGLVAGYAGGLYADGTLPAWALFATWVVAVMSFAWFSWEYFRRVDELDMLDNLWCCLFGLYFYIVAFPSWWLFHDLGLAPEINHVAIYLATLGIGAVVYIARKLGLR